jgi:hypothetical protein
VGVRITYGGVPGGVSTPSAPFTTSGESCWPGANPSWQQTSCDHFGVSTYGSPAATKYSWLVESATPGVLEKAAIGIPTVTFTPPPPPLPAQPAAPVVAVIQAQRIDLNVPQNNAYWVKIVQTTLPDNVDLNDLLAGDHPLANPGVVGLRDTPETEIEWQVLQPGFVDEVSKAVDLNGDPSMVIRYEFYKYLGRFDGEGLVDPLTAQIPQGNVLNPWVGAYIGQQIAGFNAVEAGPGPAPVPEPETAALMMAGIAALALYRRRRLARCG